LNVGLDYLWIFGKLGFPAGGIEGAGWATSVSQWFKVIAFGAMMLAAWRRNREYQFGRGRKFDRRLFLRLARFGGPSGLQWLIEAGVFSLFVLFMSQIGVSEAAATTAAFSVNGVAFVPMLGIGIAVTTLVGQRLGAGQPDLAERATWTGVILGVIYSLIFGFFYLFTPKLFLLGHAAGGDPAEYAQLESVTVVLLRFVAAYCLFDALQILFSSALKGAGDTAFVLLNTIVTAGTALAIGFTGSRLFETGLLWWWSIITCWIFALGIVYLCRFLNGRWRTMRVIEAPKAEE
jgi:MATE family multidrug resistance protein